jgi:hypothetical protein
VRTSTVELREQLGFSGGDPPLQCHVTQADAARCARAIVGLLFAGCSLTAPSAAYQVLEIMTETGTVIN